jgi:rhomboid family GlyGly-CTERM serine protease
MAELPRSSLVLLPTLSLLFVLALFLPEQWQLLLRYESEAVADGELWRLLTAHLLHLGWRHMLMNLLGLWVVWGLFLLEQKYLALGLLLIAVGTASGLSLFSPDTEWYLGFSGVLHGMLAWALLRQSKEFNPITLLLLVALVAKLAWEQIQGPLPGSGAVAMGRVIVDAHLYGAISGVLLWFLEEKVFKEHLKIEQ